MRPSMWHIAALQSCLTNFDWKKEEEEEIEENVGEKRKTMSKDSERDVLIYKRLQEELIKPVEGMRESAESWRHTIFIHQPINV